MGIQLWRRIVSVQKPCSFDRTDGMLQLKACSLANGASASSLSCVADGSRAMTLANLSTSMPCCRLRLNLQDDTTFTSSGEDILVVGVLVSDWPFRGKKRSAAEANSRQDVKMTPAAKRAAIVAERDVTETSKSTQVAVAVAKRAVVKKAPVKPDRSRETPALAVASAPLASKDKKAEKPLAPISRRVLPSGLEYFVLKVGKGALAARAKRVHVQYEGRLVTTGEIFDKGDVKFRLGLNEVIRGWDEGIQGMMVGERRRLHVPPRLGYGVKGRPPTIPPSAALIFEVELLSC